MNHYTHILLSKETKQYTILNRYNRYTHEFDGEHSILHNRYSKDSYFLNNFLVQHKGLTLQLLSNQDELFSEAIRKYTHFQNEDIAKYVQEKIEKEMEYDKNLKMDRELGQLQLLILKNEVENKYQQTLNRTTDNDNERRKLHGMEMALEWVMEKINEIIEKGNIK